MSVSKSISSTMDGSGLKEVLGLIFAEYSLEAILSGKAYDRAMRGHKLVLNGISTLIFREIEFSSEELSTINELLTGMDKPDFDVMKVLNCDVMELMTQKSLSACKSLKKRSPTAILMFKIVEAVKKGNWGLFLNAVEHTLPLFHATAHLNYAKATHLYLQKMLTLEEIMDPIEYDTYTKKQCWVVRRKNVFFSGNRDDLTIEQVFMRTMKTMGGLTHGHGTTDSIFARWIMSMIVLHDVTCAVDDFRSEGYAASEQFSDDRKALTKRDAADLEKIVEYLSSHNPFDVNDTESIVSISTALRGDERVNCHRVYEIGNSLLSGTFGKKYEDIKLQRKNKVVSLAAAQSSVTTDDGDVVRINPTLLFQRLSMIIENKEDMREHLKLELAPYPKALFDQDGMCKTRKHKFIENFTPLSGKLDCSEMKYVIDGGFLLHRIMWSQDKLIDDVLKRYVKYLTDHFSQGCTIIFDGHPDVPQARHIKSLGRARRLNQNQAQECKLRRGIKISLPKERFFSNEKNKNGLIVLLMQELTGAGHTCKQADEDADVLIVEYAINHAREFGTPTMIVGGDIDLLDFLTQLSNEKEELYFFKPGRGEIPHYYFSCKSFQPNDLSHLVAFFHAFCGCDTVSAIFGKGKNTIVKLFRNKIDLIPLAESFNKSDTPVHELIENGIKVMARLYDIE
ncbi:hypothetical protein QAD02_011913 [Eretmocerus hayati]|uniref:Uncharacterized protein n=1 Tax=Eretmocerus hayati TaxID=131215 RepID=A0ACC2NYD2_9HYME|nr:hypothetical protein QAD02_011913 [Eretmocerus hayati]